MSQLEQESRFVLARVQAAGKEAGRRGEPHSRNPHLKQGTPAEMAWFEAWFIATVEREEGRKLVPDLPDADSGLLMYCPLKKQEREL